MAYFDPDSLGGNACLTAAYSYGDWVQLTQDRWIDGNWVMQITHYQRERTNICDDTTIKEFRADGPTRFRPATPGVQIAEVNTPPQAGISAPGDPLNSADFPSPWEFSSAAPSSKIQTIHPVAPVEPGVDAPVYPDILLISGILIALASRGRSRFTYPTAPTQPERSSRFNSFESLLHKGLFLLDWLLNPIL